MPDPHDPTLTPPPAPDPLDTHVVEAGAPLDLASGSVEALLATGQVAGAPVSDLTATMAPWRLPRVGRDDIDGVEETEGP